MKTFITHIITFICYLILIFCIIDYPDNFIPKYLYEIIGLGKIIVGTILYASLYLFFKKALQ